MKKINWGIIGCGDVTELKSGPAFNKVPDSALIAVMRRNEDKAADYAKRHGVPRWYSDASQLINDPEVNAIYIATPPDVHEAYTMEAIAAGKPVYVEKPMAINYAAAQRMVAAAYAKKVKLVVAHYRREWPLFKKLNTLLEDKKIGDICHARVELFKTAFTSDQLKDDKISWRVNPGIAGGGIFHDLAPHQLDIMYQLFGPAKKITGIALNQAGKYMADDMVVGSILFHNDIVFSGSWCFNAHEQTDRCEIFGNSGKLNFSFFSSHFIELVSNHKATRFDFEALQHVQQPMIGKTVQYFLGNAANPCSGEEGAEIMRWMEEIVRMK